jgi:uncharacterized protein YkwD
VLHYEYEQTVPLPVAQESAAPATLPAAPEVEEALEGEEEIAAQEASAEPGPLEAQPPAPIVGATEQVAIVEYNEEFVAELELAIHDAINVERVRAGLNILAYDEVLAEVAAGHSTDMAKNNYFAHEDEDGCTSSCRVTAAGYRWRWVGENLFLLRSTHRYTVSEAAAIIVAGWMGSDGHRKIVLSKNFTYQGLGVVVNGNSLYATEVFARPR